MCSRRPDCRPLLRCTICNATFCETEKFHQKHCASIQERHSQLISKNCSEKHMQFSNPFSFHQSYIYDGILHCCVEEDSTIVETMKKFSNSRRLVFIHPETMKLCKISIAGHVMITSHFNCDIYIAYPKGSVKKHSISLDLKQKKYKCKEKAIVTPYRGKVSEAGTILLSTTSEEHLFEENFKKFLMQDLWNTYVYPDIVIRNRYEGSFFQLKVKQIIGKHESKSQEPSCEIPMYESTISRNFSRLNLSDTRTKYETQFLSASESPQADTPELFPNDSFSAEQRKNQSVKQAKKESVCKNDSFSIGQRKNESVKQGKKESVCRNDSISFDQTENESIKQVEKESVSPINSFSIYSTAFHSTYEESADTSLSLESSRLDNQCVLVNPKDISECFLVTSETVIQIDGYCEKIEPPLRRFGGLEEPMKIVGNYLELFLNNNEVNMSDLSNGILLYGPCGTGKTLLAEMVADQYKLNFIKVKASEIYLKNYFGESNTLKSVFKEAQERSPSILFFDELDILCEMFPNNKDNIISHLSHLIDESRRNLGSKVFLLAAATNRDSVDSSLKTGRFELEVKFELPESKQRQEILEKLLCDKSHSLKAEDVKYISETSHGFSGFQLSQMCFEAELKSVFRHQRHSSEGTSPVITFEDVENQMKKMKPHVVDNDQFTFQKVYWKDIGGMKDVKEQLTRIEKMFKNPEMYEKLKLKLRGGILLYGLPGCSKTMIAKALATESNLNFIPIKGSELLSKWVGDSEEAVRDLFKKAKKAAPCIIFFDEIDALVGQRTSSSASGVESRVVSMLLAEMNDATKTEGILVVAATNRPDMLDPAILRAGRLNKLIYVPLPDAVARREIFNLQFNKMPVQNINIEHLISKTEGYSGAEVVAVCHEAAMQALSENFPEIVEEPIILDKHFEAALQIILPRISEEEKKRMQLFSSYSEDLF